MSYELVLGWLLVITIGNALPGADFFCITSMSLRSRKLGMLCALGLQTGVTIQSLVACFGTMLIAAYSQNVFTAIQILGSMYLLYIAYVIIKGARASKIKLEQLYQQAQVEGKPLEQVDKDLQIALAASMSGWQAYCRGFFTNILNPKCFMFMATVTPQFVDKNDSFSIGMQLLILCIINVIAGLGHYAILTSLVNYLAQKFSSASFRIKLEMIGGICIALVACIILGATLYEKI